MDEEVLKTSWKQRVIIIAIAVILLASSVAVYVAVVMSGGLSSSSSKDLDTIIEEYNAKSEEIAAYLSPLYLDSMVGYKTEISGFNQEAANTAGVQARDIVEGTGTEITTDFNDYYAYYIGYCPNEAVFDSSFDDFDNPTSLKAPIPVAAWTDGMLGAKIGGVREITIPSELAHGEEEIDVCGGGNMPIRFIVYTLDLGGDEKVTKLYEELDAIDERYVEAYYEAASQYSSTDTTTTTEASE